MTMADLLTDEQETNLRNVAKRTFKQLVRDMVRAYMGSDRELLLPKVTFKNEFEARQFIVEGDKVLNCANLVIPPVGECAVPTGIVFNAIEGTALIITPINKYQTILNKTQYFKTSEFELEIVLNNRTKEEVRIVAGTPLAQFNLVSLPLKSERG